MIRRKLRQALPTPDSIRGHRWLQWCAPLLSHPRLWHLHRRAVALGVAIGLVTGLIPGPVLTGVLDTMTSWTPDCPMRGPGSELEIKRVDDVAVTLANGMREDKVLIPTDEKAWEIIRRWAASPDAFIQAKIEQFASGDRGLPIVPPALRR